MMTWVHALIAASVLFSAAALSPLLLAGSPESPLSQALSRDGLDSWRWGPHDARLQFASAAFLDPERETLVVVAPRVAFSEGEVTAIRGFLHGGGRLLLADDSGVGRQLLEQLGAEVRLAGVPLYTPGFSEVPERVVTLSTGVLPALPKEVLLHRPVTVEGGLPLLGTPALTWHDVNGNGRPDLGEPLAPAAVAAIGTTPRGGSLMVVGHVDLLLQVSDASEALLAWAAEGGRVLVVDEAHRHGSDPLGLHPWLSGRASAFATTAMLMLAAGGVALVVFAPRVRPRKTPRAPARGDDPRLNDALMELDP